MPNKQKIALVTGGNRGIGRAICTRLVQKGYALIVGSRDINLGNIAVQELSKELSAGAYPKTVELDMNNDQNILDASIFIEKEFGKLDLLVNNAAVLPNADNSIHADIDTIKASMQTNVYGPLKLIQKTIPLLRKSDDARIINVSSGMGSFSEAAAAYAAYRMSKASLNFLTSLIARDLEHEPRIKIFACCPGWVKTDMGGQNAPRTPEQGAESVLWPAFNNDAVSGKFYRDGKEINF
jgi:NAD(P)-dependent dehydrogenase (short-subunit alcohol dehydrogenase family)